MIKESINVGLIGLGRLGMKYAEILHYFCPRANLLAVCSSSLEELKLASAKFAVEHCLENIEELLLLDQLDVIFVVSTTDMHVPHIISSLRAGKHVFSEKPLSTTLSQCEEAIKVAKAYPNLQCSVGFVRRFDPSYRLAKEKIINGDIGRPFLIKSQTVDKDNTAGFQLEFAKTSGGMFHDYNVHDIDLARWYLESEFSSVFASGGAFKYPEFEKANDADNVSSSAVMENGAMVQLFASRTAMHGHDTYTEIVGTEGSLSIGRPPSSTRLQIMDQYGVRVECLGTFYHRFEEAFHLMINDFVNKVYEGKDVEMSLENAMEATRVAIAMTDSLFNHKGLVYLADYKANHLG